MILFNALNLFFTPRCYICGKDSKKKCWDHFVQDWFCLDCAEHVLDAHEVMFFVSGSKPVDPYELDYDPSKYEEGEEDE